MRTHTHYVTHFEHSPVENAFLVRNWRRQQIHEKRKANTLPTTLQQTSRPATHRPHRSFPCLQRRRVPQYYHKQRRKSKKPVPLDIVQKSDLNFTIGWAKDSSAIFNWLCLRVWKYMSNLAVIRLNSPHSFSSVLLVDWNNFSYYSSYITIDNT